MVSKVVSAYMSRIAKRSRGVPKTLTRAERLRRAQLAKGLAAKRTPKRQLVKFSS